MDFNTLDTKADANRGAWLHFVHPQLGHKLFTGDGADDAGRLIDKATAKPVRGLVLGLESDAAQEFVKSKNGDDRFGFAKALVTKLEGVSRDGKAVKADDDGLDWFFGRSNNLANQVIGFAGNAENFFEAKTT